MTNRSARKPEVVSISVSVKEHGLAPVFLAAYALSARAWVRLDGDRARLLVVTLKPRAPGGLARLAAAFRAELAAQEERWSVAEANVPVRLQLARQAVLAAEGRLPEAPAPATAGAGGPAADALTAEQQAEIDRLIAEVETEIRELKTSKEGADPDNVRATWEERHKEGA